DPASVESSADNYLDQITGDVKDLVIGINEDYFFNNIDAQIEKSVRDQIQSLVDRGAKVKPVSIPALKDAEWAGFTFSVSEGSAIHMNSVLSRAEDYGEEIRGFLVSGAFPSSTQYAEALKVRQELIRDFNEAIKNINILISPILPVMLT